MLHHPLRVIIVTEQKGDQSAHPDARTVRGNVHSIDSACEECEVNRARTAPFGMVMQRIKQATGWGKRTMQVMRELDRLYPQNGGVYQCPSMTGFICRTSESVREREISGWCSRITMRRGQRREREAGNVSFVVSSAPAPYTFTRAFVSPYNHQRAKDERTQTSKPMQASAIS